MNQNIAEEKKQNYTLNKKFNNLRNEQNDIQQKQQSSFYRG
jgi:hypothetical protein